MKGGSYMLSLQEAKTMVSESNLEKLKEVVETKPDIDTSHKVNNDIFMTALCQAVADDVIKPRSLNDRIVKLLNSETNTISQTKMTEILRTLNVHQNMKCTVILYDAEMNEIQKWDFKDNVCLIDMFDFVLHYYKITPSDIRQKMTATLKTTIVNNISQLVSKYYKSTPAEIEQMVVSISTIHRLVTMMGGILIAEFIEESA